jgi:hypothetical protein
MSLSAETAVYGSPALHGTDSGEPEEEVEGCGIGEGEDHPAQRNPAGSLTDAFRKARQQSIQLRLHSKI